MSGVPGRSRADNRVSPVKENGPRRPVFPGVGGGSKTAGDTARILNLLTSPAIGSSISSCKRIVFGKDSEFDCPPLGDVCFGPGRKSRAVTADTWSRSVEISPR
jgi:hypothetical protein